VAPLLRFWVLSLVNGFSYALVGCMGGREGARDCGIIEVMLFLDGVRLLRFWVSSAVCGFLCAGGCEGFG